MPVATAPAIIIRGEQIAKYRNHAGLTSHVALAKATGVNASTVERILSGRTEPSARFIFQLAHILGARVEDLFTQAPA